MRYTEAECPGLQRKCYGISIKTPLTSRIILMIHLKNRPFLPAVLPNLLINGTSGIAVGMATNIPPHNLTEIISGVEALIDNPDMEID